jgi:hypothetical protein
MTEDDLRGGLCRHQGAGAHQAGAGGGGRWWAQLPDVWKSWRWQDVDRPTLFSCKSDACGRNQALTLWLVWRHPARVHLQHTCTSPAGLQSTPLALREASHSLRSFRLRRRRRSCVGCRAVSEALSGPLLDRSAQPPCGAPWSGRSGRSGRAGRGIDTPGDVEMPRVD